MRIAWASPVPPARSGIADYAAELLPRLAGVVDIEVFFDGVAAPEETFARSFTCRPVGDLPAAAAHGEYDLVVYQLGNHFGFHGRIWRVLQVVPGVVELHELTLHHMLREMTLGRGDPAGYQEALRYAVGESGWRAAHRLIDNYAPWDVDAWRFPLFEQAVDASRAVLVHSEFARRRILASRPLAAVEVVPLAVDTEALHPASAEERTAARRLLGVAPGGFLVGSFGFVTAQKRLQPVLSAFARLRQRHPGARLVVAGEIQAGYDFQTVIRESGAENLIVTGRVPLADLHLWMTAVDAAVNLRYPTGGETSATLLRLLALGIPTLVTPVGSFAELPPGSCLPVDVNEFEQETLELVLERLADDAELRGAVGREARRFAETEHALPQVACRLLDRFRALAMETERGGQKRAVPPLAPWRPPNLAVELQAALGAAAGDLGIGELDEEFLGAVGKSLVEVGLDRLP